MQKSIVALAVAGVLAASAVAQAETTLYGSARVGVEYVQGKKYVQGKNGKGAEYSSWDVADQASRLGVKGSEDLGGGLSAIYQYEFGVAIDGSGGSNPLSARLSFVGLQGGFGTVALGRQFRPAYTYVSQYTDIFNGNITNPYSETSTDQRVSDLVAYVSPNFNGFSFAGGVTMNGNGTNSATNREDIDIVEVAGGYSNGPLNVGVYYSSGPDSKNDRYDSWGIGGSYVVGAFSFGASFESHDAGARGVQDFDGYGFVFGYDVLANTTLRATWGRQSKDDAKINGVKSKGVDQDMWGLGVEHRLSKRTMLYVEYVDSEFGYDTSANGATKGKYGSKYATLGMRHDF